MSVVDSPAVPGVDFWLDWRVRTTVEHLRGLLPRLLADIGDQLVEIESIATHVGWAQLSLEADGAAVGMIRAQDEPDGRAQLLIAPGAAREPDDLAALNRAALALYCGLLSRGLLDPPPPLEVPNKPLVAPKE
jgi:hypothetical protein